MGGNGHIKTYNMTGQAGPGGSSCRTDQYKRLRHAEVIQKGLNLCSYTWLCCCFFWVILGDCMEMEIMGNDLLSTESTQDPAYCLHCGNVRRSPRFTFDLSLSFCSNETNTHPEISSSKLIFPPGCEIKTKRQCTLLSSASLWSGTGTTRPLFCSNWLEQSWQLMENIEMKCSRYARQDVFLKPISNVVISNRA